VVAWMFLRTITMPWHNPCGENFCIKCGTEGDHIQIRHNLARFLLDGTKTDYKCPECKEAHLTRAPDGTMAVADEQV